MVAKSYMALQQVGEPFEENKKMYIYVIMKSGSQKKVRWYSEYEYYKLYPEEKPAEPRYDNHSIFGFGEKNFIWIFPTAKDENDEVMLDFNSRTKLCQYATFLGWFSRHEFLNENPCGRPSIKLPWDVIKDAPRENWKKIINKYIKEKANGSEGY